MPGIGRLAAALPFALPAIIAFALPLLLLVLNPSAGSVSAMCALSGLGSGYVILHRISAWKTAGTIPRKILRYLLGICGTALFYFGLKMIFPAEGESGCFILRCIPYVLSGFWISLGAPLLLKKINNHLQSRWLARRSRLLALEGLHRGATRKNPHRLIL